jgi:membrane-bound serine protease (ClpP class)
MTSLSLFDYIGAFFSLLPIQFLLLLAGLALIIFLIVALIAIAGKKARLFDFITLKTEITGTSGGIDPDEPVTEKSMDLTALIGKTGAAVTTLRPVGKAEIDGRVYQVETDGVYVEKGGKIEVVHVFGNRIVVKGGVL